MSPFPSALALFAASCLLTLGLGSPLIAALRRASYRQQTYEDAPKTHAVKSGTPTMGGVLFLTAIVLAVVWHPSPATAALAVLGLACGAIGFVDDYSAIRSGRNRGLRAREKFALTALAGVAFLMLVARFGDAPARDAIFTAGALHWYVPHWVWYALSLSAIVATTHAVNLTDGLDGLATGSVLPPLLVLAWLAVRSASGAVFTDVAVAGAALGFLWYNRHPARVFMGDTGALALGGILAGSAVLTGNHLLLPIVGGVFAAETLSVILQVASFKATGKRIFRMSPLHHHFELGGWPETTVTLRFWTASAALSLAGAALAR